AEWPLHRHARACRGHPRLPPPYPPPLAGEGRVGAASKTWMARTSPAMTPEKSLNSIRPHRPLYGRAPHEPARVGRKIVPCMGRAAVVPHQEIADTPDVAIDEFRAFGVVEHRIEEFVAFGLRHVDDLHGHEAIDIDRLAARLVVGAKHRMHGLAEG